MQNTSINIQMARAELSQHLAFRSQLLAEIPDLDQETLADTLEGLTNLREMLAEVIRSALDDEAMAAGIALRLAELKGRLDRFEARAKRKRQLALQAIAEADMPKLVEPDFSAALKLGAPSVEIQAEDKIPAAYWKPQPAKLDKLGILAALKTGTAIDGAVLVAPKQQLTVRTK
jgi:hypothetical protein